MAKQSFLGLVKISGEKWQQYDLAKTVGTGKIIFADIKGTNAGKYIFANGIEYKVADSTDLDELIKRVADVSQYAIDSSNRLNDLSTFVRKNVDASVLDLSTRVGTLETWKSVVNVSIEGLDVSVNNYAGRIKDLEDASVTLGGRIEGLENASNALAGLIADVNQDVININTYVHNTVDTINDISTRLSNVGIIATNNQLSISGLKTSVSSLETWKSVVNGSIADLYTSVNTYAGRIEDLEDASVTLGGRIEDLEVASNALVGLIDDVSQDVIDISTRLSSVSITAANNKLTVNGTDVALSGSNYVTVTAANNSVNVSLNALKIQDGGSAEGHEKLATKGYVDEQISVLEQALVFKGGIASTADASTKLTEKDVQAGYTYVATDAGEYNSEKFEGGDLIIVGTDAPAGTVAEIIIVERNLDGAVTTGGALDSSKLVVGTGDQGVKTIDVTAEDLATAIANANSAIQGVKAAGTQNDYVKISVENSADSSTKDVSATLTVVDTSVALSAVDATGKLVDAKAVKDLVSDVKVQATLNSSTPDYVVATASVDETGRIISSSVGVKVATLSDASNGGADFKALADARNVYEELTAVEEVMATANSEMVLSIGLNSDYSVTWSTASGISTDASIVKAIEEVAQKAEQAMQSSVKSIEGETAISKRANDEYVAVSVTTVSQGNVTLNSSVQLAENISLSDITGVTAATATGLATDATVKDYVAYALAWDVIGG